MRNFIFERNSFPTFSIECFLVLPAHLAHFDKGSYSPGKFRIWFDNKFKNFQDGIFKKIITYCPAVAAIALLAYGIQDAGGVEPDIIKDATEMLMKGKKLKAMDLLDYVGDADMQGVAEEQI